MGTELVAMSKRELERLDVVRRVVEGRLTQAKAGEFVGLSERQVRRLCAAFEERGPAGLVSGKRGQPSNRRSPDELRLEAIEIVRQRYADFGPTLACEKLLELHDLQVSKETLRSWLIAAGVWLPRRERIRMAHQPRHRRECLGELVQIDGCDHAWFEERGTRCTLLVYVDDATSRLMELRFVKSESAFDYFASTRAYLERQGKPVAFYSDKHSIFRVNHEGSTGRAGGVTQFGRALAELNIDIICANSPQAKGRVERMNKTLQDRLVKELRLRDISTMDAGNAFLPQFMADYNRRFERTAKNGHDAHRPLQGDEDLSRVFTWQEERRMSRNLVVHFKRSHLSGAARSRNSALRRQAGPRLRTGGRASRDPLRGPTASLLAPRQAPLRPPGRDRGEQASRRGALGDPGLAGCPRHNAPGLEEDHASR